MKKYLLLALILGLLTGVLGGVNWLYEKSYKPKGEMSKDLDQVRKIFDRYEIEDAYQIYLATYSKYHNPVVTHNLAHYVGEYIYKVKGIEGVTLCGDEFNYGCYHGFYGRAFSQLGSAIIQSAEEVCSLGKDEMEEGGCIHGIGHGVLAFYGYDLDKLVLSLNLCDTMTNIGNRAGCYNGVMMEFNMKTMQGPSAQAREFDEQNVLDPCPQLQKLEHQAACYYELPSWWLSSGVEIQMFGEYCQKVGADLRDDCIEGVGRIIPVAYNFEAKKTADYCQTLASQDIYLCAVAAGKTLRANGFLNALDICAIMKEGEEKKCREYLGQK